MLVQIHLIRNFSPSNLNRDDLGSPKTCYFGGTLRARISSQCIKRSIRRSEYFRGLQGCIRTRRLAYLIAGRASGITRNDLLLGVKDNQISEDFLSATTDALKKCGLMGKDEKSADQEESKAAIFISWNAVENMANSIRENIHSEELPMKFAKIISQETYYPDIALFGRMLEPAGSKEREEGGKGKKDTSKIWKDLVRNVEASLQCSHALSTHTIYPEVDYFVAADDIPGEDAGAAFLDEFLYTSACFYLFFSIDWNQLLKNLNGFPGNKEHLAAHTVGAFLQAAALVTPTGKQNSFAAHNPASGVMVELRDGTPISYANAFVKPVEASSGQDLVARSIAQLAHYVRSMDKGFGKPRYRAWFSPGMLHPFAVDPEMEKGGLLPKVSQNFTNLEELVRGFIREMGYEWEEVKRVTLYPEE